MSALTNQPTDLSLYSGSRYKFVCDALPNMSYFCQKVKIPGITIDTTMQFTSQIARPMVGNQIQFDEFEIDFILDVNFSGYKEMYKWMFNSFNLQNNTQYSSLQKEISQTVTSDGTLYLLNNNLNPNLIIKFHDLVPTRLSSIVLDIDVPDDNIKTAQSVFEYTYFEFI